MKRNFIWFLLIVLIASLLSACAPEDVQNQRPEPLIEDDEQAPVTNPSLPADDTPPVAKDIQEDVDEEIDEAPKAKSSQTKCTDSVRGDVSTNGVVTRGAATFEDYCCGADFKVDYYCEGGDLKSNPNVHCPGGCVDDTCIPEECGNSYCYADEFATCPQDFPPSSDFIITKIEYNDLAGELTSPYVSFTLANQADEEINLRNYYFVFYNLATPELTSSPVHAFAYTIIGSKVVPAGEEMLVTIKQQGLAMDDEFCGQKFRVGLAKQKMFGRCSTAISIATEIVAMNELTLTC